MNNLRLSNALDKKLSMISKSPNDYVSAIPCKAILKQGDQIDVYAISLKDWNKFTFNDKLEDKYIVSPNDIIDFQPSENRLSESCADEIYALYKSNISKMKVERFFFKIEFKDESIKYYYMTDQGLIDFLKLPDNKISTDIVGVRAVWPGMHELSKNIDLKYEFVGFEKICLYEN